MARRKIATVERDGHAVAVYRDSEYGEYQVRGSWMRGYYHTDNKADAMGTAEAMLSHRTAEQTH